MKKTFLEYYKMILSKVSFDLELLEKEYHKAKESLNGIEIFDSNNWLENKGFSFSLLSIEVYSFCKDSLKRVTFSCIFLLNTNKFKNFDFI